MKKQARCIMIQGTASAVGKSLITAGLCRIFKQDGYRVAPFKSQNMALNSFITADGAEMGRAQVVQAEAAGREPDVRMNPILLKPTTDQCAQVIVGGKVYGNMSAVEYHEFKPQLAGMVTEIYMSLAAENDILVIEGAGSPAEINLRDKDIVNMGMAALVDAPVLLVGDIDKGGVFASLAGTMLLLTEAERRRVQGVIINKFRGDRAILEPGIAMLEEIIKRPVLGVVPYTKLDIDDEDSLTERFAKQSKKDAVIDVAVVKLPHLSNFTDFNSLDNIPGVQVRYVEDCRRFGAPDLIILPGTKNTLEDLEQIQRTGLVELILEQHRQGTAVCGICGGYQMLGREVRDPHGVESARPRGREAVAGLGLLNAVTVLQKEKMTTQAQGTVCGAPGLLAGLQDAPVTGYEIHMGTTEWGGDCIPFVRLTAGEPGSGGVCNAAGNVFGTYLHGIFDNPEFALGLINNLRRQKGLAPLAVTAASFSQYKEKQYDTLAGIIRQHVAVDRIYRIMNDWGAGK